MEGSQKRKPQCFDTLQFGAGRKPRISASSCEAPRDISGHTPPRILFPVMRWEPQLRGSSSARREVRGRYIPFSITFGLILDELSPGVMLTVP